MRRRDFMGRSAAFAALAALPGRGSEMVKESTATGVARGTGGAAASTSNSLQAPAKGKIPVAFVLSRGAVMIDFAGPWAVFGTVMVPSRGPAMDDQMPFDLYTVAETAKAVSVSDGMKIEPNYTFDNAPTPKVIVIPAQSGGSKRMVDWIKSSSQHADLTMSVCTGAFVLADTGLLAGKPATTHHGAYRELALKYPDIQVKRGARFVDAGNVATAGGLSSGIDLALHVVERYFGHAIATSVAYEMEYQGQGWTNPESNAVYAAVKVSTDEHPVCPVCEMDVNPAGAPKSTYKGKTYYFCSPGHKASFDTAPEKWV
jgi:transcriptional regulator GlxA family with amidase domain/YHS domain-containing protein